MTKSRSESYTPPSQSSAWVQDMAWAFESRHLYVRWNKPIFSGPACWARTDMSYWQCFGSSLEAAGLVMASVAAATVLICLAYQLWRRFHQIKEMINSMFTKFLERRVHVIRPDPPGR